MNDYNKDKSELITEVQELRRQLSLLQRPASVIPSDNTSVMPPTTARLDGTNGSDIGTKGNYSLPSTYTQLVEAFFQYAERLEEVQRVARLGYYSYDVINNTSTRSPVLLDILGIDESHSISFAGWRSIVHPDFRAIMEAHLIDSVENHTGIDIECQIIHGKSGQTRWVHGLGQLRFNSAGEPIELFGTIQDITERKEAEAAIQKSNKTYRDLIDGMNETVWVIGPNLTFLDVNRTATQVMQYSREELLAMGPLDIDDTLDSAAISKMAEMMSKDRVQVFQTTHRAKDGRHIPVEIQSTLVTYQGQEAILSIARDITERREAETALRKSEALNRLLAAVVEQASEAIAITDINGLIEYVNPAYEAMTGFTAEDAIGRRLPLFERNLQEPTATHPLAVVQRNTTWTGRYIDKRNDGSIYNKDAMLFAIHDATGQITNYCKIARDISHELQLERQLNQAQRLETIGTLAGGIAHDFNNMLTPIMGYAEMAASHLPSADPLQANMQQIIRGAYRARELVKQILTFSRQHEQERQPIFLHVVITEALKLMRPSIPSTIEIHQQIDSHCEKVLADATQIHQVIVNLCTNAFHAMETNGGILTIILEQVKLEPALAQIYPALQQTDYARITVRDSGVGMDTATMERIFEPFFTTKAVDRGTGLGLSVAHGIIRSHEGTLIVKSEPGKGSSFQVYLPIFHDDSDMGSEHGIDFQRGKETILLVDDEVAVTDVMQMMLEWLGYEVVSYNNSLEALTVFRQQPDRYDLVISDLTMPTMTGVDLAAKLQEVRAGIPVMIITGYGNNLNDETQKRFGIRHVAGKPIVINELAALIRQVLDR